MNALVIRSKESIEKELKPPWKDLKTYRKQNCDASKVISRIRMLENWRLYGGSVDDEKTPATGEETAILLCMVQHLLDFYEKDNMRRSPVMIQSLSCTRTVCTFQRSRLTVSGSSASCLLW